jgi:RNA methyltransferase, TrmH family
LEETSSVPLTLMDDALFAELSELKSLSAVLAVIDVIALNADPKSSSFCVLLEGIQDPGNVGSILRSAAAAGCDAVFMSQGCADAWSPKVLRAAMGGHFVLSIYENVDLIKIANLFPGVVYSAALSSKTSLYDSCLSGKIALAIGNEGAGLTDSLLALSKTFIIPMPGKVESLNAAAAAAVCLFEAVRQRI